MKKKFMLSLSLILGLSGCNFDNSIDGVINSNISSTSSSTQEISTQLNSISTTVTIYKESSELTPTTVEEAVQRVYDSVVVINAYSMSGSGAGAGVIFASNDEYSFIVTCHHVIEGATTFKVILSDEKEYDATLVGGDDETDIAVLAIEKTGLTVSHFTDDSDKIKVGSTAIAIGNPLGTLANTVTVGVVSAVSRHITTSDGTTRQLIQTDAAINSGNSGGGLFNSAGELIGIVSSKYSSASIEGLAFAVPANIAFDVSNQLLEHGYVEGRYKLGIVIKDGYYSTGGFIGGKQYKVSYIYSVDSDGCASGKLYREDIVEAIKIDYKDETKADISLDKVENASEANEFIENANLSIGDKIIFTVKQDGYNKEATEVTVTITQYIYRIK